MWSLVSALTVSRVIGLFYYLRVILTKITAGEPVPEAAGFSSTGHGLSGWFLGLLLLDIYPEPAINPILST